MYYTHVQEYMVLSTYAKRECRLNSSPQRKKSPIKNVPITPCHGSI